MQTYYKPTENPTLANVHFRKLQQETEETFTAFCNRVEKEAVHCYFKCANDNCTADTIAIRTNCHNIREESLLKSWDLQQLCTEGMRMESALRGGTEIRGDT